MADDFTPMPNGLGETWQMEMDRDQYEKALEEVQERWKWCRENNKDTVKDLAYVTAKMRIYYYRLEYELDREKAIVRARRSDSEKELGRMYGRASESIRLLKLENAYLRSYPRKNWPEKEIYDKTLSELHNRIEEMRDRMNFTRQYDEAKNRELKRENEALKEEIENLQSRLEQLEK